MTILTMALLTMVGGHVVPVTMTIFTRGCYTHYGYTYYGRWPPRARASGASHSWPARSEMRSSVGASFSSLTVCVCVCSVRVRVQCAVCSVQSACACTMQCAVCVCMCAVCSVRVHVCSASVRYHTASCCCRRTPCERNNERTCSPQLRYTRGIPHTQASARALAGGAQRG